MGDAARLLDLADRIVAELLHAATRPEADLSRAERCGLVALALHVDRDAAGRLGILVNAAEILAAARVGGIALGRDTT